MGKSRRGRPARRASRLPLGRGCPETLAALSTRTAATGAVAALAAGAGGAGLAAQRRMDGGAARDGEIMRSARLLGFAPLLCLLLPLLFYHQLAFSGMIFARGDAFNYFYPYWDTRNAAYRQGELPLWTPDLFMGAPLLANPQLGSYYPPNWLTAPLRAPAAMSLSIVLHIALAGLGMVYLYRTAQSRSPLPALTAGAVYAFGGVLAAHVEQINQLQGLAWMPILFALVHRLLTRGQPRRDMPLLAAAWALQIFSGHTQTVFISGIGLLVYALARAGRGRKQLLKALLLLAGCFGLALALASSQLLPSLELMGMSNRGSGFSLQAATAFSLPPSLLGRSLLPSYDGQLFGEYVAYIGVIGLGLALLAARRRCAWLLLAGVGLALALGRHNPLYLLLGELPGFDLFRVPARFLALYSLGMAMLAGRGIELLGSVSYDRRRVLSVAGTVLLLILLTRFVLQPSPEHFFGEPGISRRGLGLWLGTWLLLLGLLVIRRRWTPWLACALVIGELLLAAQTLPDKDLAPPDVYLGQRFTISQLQALHKNEIAPGRTLSISRLYFDPGDLAALRERFDTLGMDESAQSHALDAVKKQEMLMPNQALTWGISSIDGFGGGILPSNAYTQLTSLLLPADSLRAVDGRLGERLALPDCRGACLPALQWLQVTDTRYLITDKIHDIWHEGIAYDTTLALYWQGITAGALPDYTDQARVLHSEPLADTSASIRLPDGAWLTSSDAQGLAEILRQDAGIIAISAVNSRHSSLFRQLQPAGFARLLSSDIEIYELPPGQRASLAADPVYLPDDWQSREAALELLRGGAEAIIHGAPPLPASNLAGAQVEITAYADTHVALRVKSPAATYLVLADAWYPGWTATVNGAATPVYRANVMFRAVAVPAGESPVLFQFEPRLWRAALYFGLAIWAIVGGAWLWLWRKSRNSRASN
ncbi:MAG: YfhO family protein [Chloroflexi bacterium]|nr:YfhO family protein [Chloroflexota bacterium]